jgi:chromosomal replication initiator protein
MQTFAHWVSLPENQAARLAVERVADGVCARPPQRGATRSACGLNPLFLHGPAGTGKTHLVSALVADVTGRMPDLTVAVLAAGEFEALLRPGEPASELADARQADLLIVEDLQHLSPRAVEAFAHLVDRCQARGQHLVFTASVGPAQLAHLPARLVSRLVGGLVAGLMPLSPLSRRVFLEDRARRRRLAVERPVLAWLAEHVPGSARQLEGAVHRLETLARVHGQPPTLDAVAEHFRVEADSRRPTMERIAQRVGCYFRVEPQQLQSRRRSRDALLPRQVGMYLARQLTELSLQQIGAWFGGRDHSTVLHACRKVERALGCDATLCGAVRQLHADLA